MDTDDDYKLALLLQEEYDRETAVNAAEDDIYFVGEDGTPSSAIPNIAHLPLPGSPGSPKSIVDKEWELLDPNPDIRALFLQFNDMFFWERLNGIEVKWSPRMTLCAGLCVYEGRGGLCSVRLSLPLLKLRPREDLVQTLLHEMIHAYLFVTDNNKDHDGHGPEFQKHMKRINSASGSNITIYHTFHDEVAVYKQHVWQCNGPCQKRPPYFGLLKRAMNRAPSARDPWWADHQKKCGGTYEKIREPEGYGKKKSKAKVKEIEEKKKNLSKFNDIRAFMGPGKVLGGKKDGEKEKSKPSATVSKSSSDDDVVTVVKSSEKKNSESGSSRGHSSSSSKQKSDDHKSHKDSHDKGRHGSHSGSKDRDHKRKSSSKDDADRHKSDKKHSSSKDSDSKKHSSEGKSSDGSLKKKESSSSGEKHKKSNIHGVEGSSKDSEVGDPGPVVKGSNVHGFSKSSSSKEKSSSPTVAFSGKGNVLGSRSESKSKGDREKHKHEKEKHRHKDDDRGKSKDKEKSHSKKRPSEEGSSSQSSSKKAKHEEDMVFGHRRTSKFRGDKPSAGAALNDPDDMVPCPVCATRVRATDINGHLDSCLGGL